MADRHVTDLRGSSGLDPATGEPVDLWIADGRFVDGPIADAVELTGLVLPGFVDAHCHVGYSSTGRRHAGRGRGAGPDRTWRPARWRCGTAGRRWTPGRWSAGTTCRC